MYTGYRYIERAYGVRFNAGMRVKFTEPGTKLFGSLGTVEKAKGDPQYVSVKFDGGGLGLCHPKSLDIVEAAP